MKIVDKILLIYLLSTSIGFSQTTSDKLKREQSRLEQKISDTKFLLSKSKSAKEASLDELKIIENQIFYREQLLKNYDNQIRAAELTLKSKVQQIDLLYEKIDQLKKQYQRLLIYAYKNRNIYGKMMFIFSSGSYFEALKRIKYLEYIAEIQEKQFLAIRQHQALIEEEIIVIENEKENKRAIIQEKLDEKSQIEFDRKKQEYLYQKFKNEENVLISKLAKEERLKKKLRDRINEAIRQEIAAEAARRKKEEERLASSDKNNNLNSSSEESIFSETKESYKLNASFEKNKGRLPWPVERGNITERFGKNSHPTLKNVTTNNRGIDISTAKNSKVRSVFKGRVTSVLKIPGAGKVIIIKHGNYRTVYSNLQDTYVKTGMSIDTKKVIGTLLLSESVNMSIAHFEIHHVIGSKVTCLNPTLWISH